MLIFVSFLLFCGSVVLLSRLQAVFTFILLPGVHVFIDTLIYCLSAFSLCFFALFIHPVCTIKVSVDVCFARPPLGLLLWLFWFAPSLFLSLCPYICFTGPLSPKTMSNTHP